MRFNIIFQCYAKSKHMSTIPKSLTEDVEKTGQLVDFYNLVQNQRIIEWTIFCRVLDRM